MNKYLIKIKINKKELSALPGPAMLVPGDRLVSPVEDMNDQRRHVLTVKGVRQAAELIKHTTQGPHVGFLIIPSTSQGNISFVSLFNDKK